MSNVPINCRQRLAAEGRPFPKSSCASCGQFSPKANQCDAMLAAPAGQAPSAGGEPFQSRVLPWMLECFGAAISADTAERNHRFLEEALELVQACGATQEEARRLVDYVYGRDTGEPAQEVGGVMVTLAALCLAHKMDMHAAGETELARIWTKVDQIRAKQAAKPAMSPLPGSYLDHQALPATAKVDELLDIDAAARKLSECMYYPWDHLPESGRELMREHAKAVIETGRAKLNPTLKP